MPCWPDTYNCYVSFCPYCSRSGSTSFDSQSGPTASPATTEIFNARMSGASSRRLDKIGKFLQTAGAAQIAAAPHSMPASSRKIWTPLMRHQVMKKREAHYGTKGASHMRKNPRKYDWYPKNPKNYVKYKDPHRRGSMYSSPRDAHSARQPRDGSRYSKPSQKEIATHRHL